MYMYMQTYSRQARGCSASLLLEKVTCLNLAHLRPEIAIFAHAQFFAEASCWQTRDREVEKQAEKAAAAAYTTSPPVYYLLASVIGEFAGAIPFSSGDVGRPHCCSFPLFPPTHRPSSQCLRTQVVPLPRSRSSPNPTPPPTLHPALHPTSPHLHKNPPVFHRTPSNTSTEMTPSRVR